MQRATTPRESRNTQARTVSRRWWCDAEPLLEVALADDGNRPFLILPLVSRVGFHGPENQNKEPKTGEGRSALFLSHCECGHAKCSRSLRKENAVARLTRCRQPPNRQIPKAVRPTCEWNVQKQLC